MVERQLINVDRLIEKYHIGDIVINNSDKIHH